MQTVHRIVTRARGSWKYQDAFGAVAYEPHTTRDGRRVWKAAYDVVGKISMPQLRRAGYADLEHGSLHHKPIESV